MTNQERGITVHLQWAVVNNAGSVTSQGVPRWFSRVIQSQNNMFVESPQE